MKAVYRAAVVLAALICLIPLTALAQVKEGSVELNVFGGRNLFGDSQNLKNRSVYGARAGYNFTPHFGLEGVYEIVRSRVDDRSITVGKEGRYISPADVVRINIYHIDAIYHFTPEKKLTPFIAGGFGISRYRPSISTKAMATFNAGMGIKYWLSENVAFRADLRDSMVGEVFQETFHNVVATIGITIAVGGGAKPEPVAKVEAEPEPVRVAIAQPEPKVEEPVVIEKIPPRVIQPVVIVVSEPEFEKIVEKVVAEPKIEEKVVVLAFEDIHFEFDSSTLTPEAKAILKRNIEVLRKNPKAIVRIAGYTSASGTDEYNQKLSERRANAVKDYLVQENVMTPERLSQIGYGENDPESYEIAPKDLYSPAAKSNMRVLFQIILK